MAEHRRVVILGIPIDDINEDQVVQEIRRGIDRFRDDGRARQICTVNVDFVVNTLSWSLERVHHPELLHILQTADLNTADGMPIVLISRLLGLPLSERVTGADLVPRLASEGFSLYFLGGTGRDGETAARRLRERHQATNIVAVDAPFIHTTGAALADSEAEDADIIGRINRARPEILLVALGNPKQELWFNRNRHRLKVPVTIGVGGTFSFIAGTVRRAPRWMQKSGLEWVFRLAVDPRRLWKRYFVGFFKFGFLVFPSLIYHRRRLRAEAGEEHREVAMDGTSVHLPDLTMLRPEGRLDAASAADFSNRCAEALARGGLVLDLEAVSLIDSTGLGALLTLRRNAMQKEVPLRLANISETVRRLMELTRTWKIFENLIVDVPSAGLDDTALAAGGPELSHAVEREEGATVLVLAGRLDQRTVDGIDPDELGLDDTGRGLLVDGTGLDFIDSTGIRFLLKLIKSMARMEKPLAVCGLAPELEQVLRMTGVDKLISTAVDRPSGLKRLGTRPLAPA